MYYDPAIWNPRVKPFITANRGLHIGTIYVAQILDIAFFTLITVMLVTYLSRSGKGLSQEKVVVVVAYLLCFCSSIAGLVWTYRAFVLLYGEYMQFVETFFQPTMFLIESMEIGIIQVHLAYRVFKLWGRKWIVLILLSALSTGMVVSGFLHFFNIRSIGNALITDPGPKVSMGQAIWLSFMVAADLSITGTISLYLLSHRSGFDKTNQMLWRLLVLTCETQLLPPIFAMVQLISQQLTDRTYFRIPLFFLGGKLYLIGLLYAISSRESIKQEHASHSHSDGAFSSQSQQIRSRSVYPLERLDHPSHQDGVRVDVSQVQLTDPMYKVDSVHSDADASMRKPEMRYHSA